MRSELVKFRNKKETFLSWQPLLLFWFLYAVIKALELSAEPSSFSDCSRVSKESINQGPLTRKEKLSLLSDDFSIELSKFEQCKNNNVSSNSNGMQDLPDSTDSTDTSIRDSSSRLDGQADRKEKSKPAVYPDDSTLSSNLLKSGEHSLALTDDGKLMLENFDTDFETPLLASDLKVPPPLAGRAHEKLEKSDNLKILKEQIKAKAEQEKDPEIKAALMRRYEEL